MCYHFNKKIKLVLVITLCVIQPMALAQDPFMPHTTEGKSYPASSPVIMQTKLITIKHVQAEKIAKLIKSNKALMGEGSSLSVDNHSNRILIYGSPSLTRRIANIIRQLDIAMPQIVIQARIMNIDRQYERSLGVSFGVTQANHLSGTLRGANQIANNALNDATEPVANIPFAERLNFDMPAAIDTLSQVPSIGIALAKLGKGILLDLELSAVEAEGGGQLLSAPHLVTSNHEAAFIEAGEEIPYEESAYNGATTVAFKKAVLGLKVVPEILANDNINLDIKVNQDKRGNDIVKGEPAIDTRQLSTHVIVKSGETIVLGGIFEQDKRDKVIRVPFLGKLPILGNFFTSRYKATEEDELLIFLTPTIYYSE